MVLNIFIVVIVPWKKRKLNQYFLFFSFLQEVTKNNVCDLNLQPKYQSKINKCEDLTEVVKLFQQFFSVRTLFFKVADVRI